MSVESASTIAELVSTNPTVMDPVHDGPQHFWMIKNALKYIFPGTGGVGFAKPITATEDDLNAIAGMEAVSADLPAHITTIDSEIEALQSTVSSLQSTVNGLVINLQKIYPVGSVYCNASNNANPADIVGFGTWEAFGQQRVLVGVGPTAPFDTPANTGGNANAVLPAHTHSGATDYQGSHAHSYQRFTGGQGGSFGAGNFGQYSANNTDNQGSHAHNITINSAGVSPVNQNYPPYITVYMWKRTA
jgi:hypothetical protein